MKLVRPSVPIWQLRLPWSPGNGSGKMCVANCCDLGCLREDSACWFVNSFVPACSLLRFCLYWWFSFLMFKLYLNPSISYFYIQQSIYSRPFIF